MELGPRWLKRSVGVMTRNKEAIIQGMNLWPFKVFKQWDWVDFYKRRMGAAHAKIKVVSMRSRRLRSLFAKMSTHFYSGVMMNILCNLGFFKNWTANFLPQWYGRKQRNCYKKHQKPIHKLRLGYPERTVNSMPYLRQNQQPNWNVPGHKCLHGPITEHSHYFVPGFHEACKGSKSLVETSGFWMNQVRYCGTTVDHLF